jgi:hypothetical protein
MSTTYRPIYDTENVTFQFDTNSAWQSLPGVSASVSATNFQSVAGAFLWTVQVPNALTAAVGTLNVQINNSNAILRGDARSGSGNIQWTVNPILNQTSQGKRNVIMVNSGFTANWTTVGTVQSLSAFQIPARFVRLTGVGTSALVGSSVALLWTEGMTVGN